MIEANKTYFMHLRQWGEDKSLINNAGMTLAWRMVKAEDGVFTIEVAKSICSEQDNFCKAKGREVARDRLDHMDVLDSIVRVGKTKELVFGTVLTQHTLFRNIRNTLENWAYGAY